VFFTGVVLFSFLCFKYSVLVFYQCYYFLFKIYIYFVEKVYLLAGMSAIFLFCNLMFLIIVSCIFIITFLTVYYTIIPGKILILSINRIIILRSCQIFLTASYTLIHCLLLFYLIRLVFNLIIHLSNLQIQI